MRSQALMQKIHGGKESGVTILEYAMLLSLFSISSMIALNNFGMLYTETFEQATLSLCDAEIACFSESPLLGTGGMQPAHVVSLN